MKRLTQRLAKNMRLDDHDGFRENFYLAHLGSASILFHEPSCTAVVSWKSDRLDGIEFASLILSNA